MSSIKQKADAFLERVCWKRRFFKKLEETRSLLAKQQTDVVEICKELKRQQIDAVEIHKELKKQAGSLNFYDQRLSNLVQTLELMRGDYVTLNELFRIPETQPFPKPMTGYTLAGQALEILLREYAFDSVLDIGCGRGQHTSAFIAAGKDVYVNDIYESDFIRENQNKLHAYFGDFNTYTFDRQFDCVWASHVLEHQLNPNLFLRKVHGIIKEGGALALTVPPPRGLMAGGHVCLWNPGLMLYHLVLAGFNCSEARVMRYGYNQSVLLRKHSIDVTDKLEYGSRDIEVIRPYLPQNIPYLETALGLTFDGTLDAIAETEKACADRPRSLTSISAPGKEGATP